ncbi:MAG: DM13 domain-containing protein [Chloroflexi bacterium]|nr:DM13 domain-containing protein [Chloroflexota bacterium]MCC6895598.1 DM13 domain-containing protein [Anaerolineae bacterium]
MNIRLRAFIIFIGTLLVAVVFTFPLWRPFFVRTVVTDVFPGLSAAQQNAFLLLSDDQREIYDDMLDVDVTMAVAMAQAGTSPDIIIPTEQQGMPAMTNPTVVAGGTFTEIDVVHTAAGTATIYQLPDNTRILRLENFKVTNAPNLHLYMTRNPKPEESKDIGTDYIDLGPIQANVGNQNYPVPTEVDLSAYRGLVLYSQPYNVIFSTAELRLS